MCPVMCADRGPTRLYKAERQESFRAKNPNRLPLVDRSPPAAQSLITSEKIKNQTRPRRVTARAVLITNSKSTDGPGSACRASVGVSMIIPCFLVTIERSQISVRHPPGQTPAFFLYHPA